MKCVCASAWDIAANRKLTYMVVAVIIVVVIVIIVASATPHISLGLVICTFHCSEISPLGHKKRLVANRQAVSVTRLGEISPFGQIFFLENLPNKSATFCAIFWREIVAIKRELF